MRVLFLPQPLGFDGEPPLCAGVLELEDAPRRVCARIECVEPAERAHPLPTFAETWQRIGLYRLKLYVPDSTGAVLREDVLPAYQLTGHALA